MTKRDFLKVGLLSVGAGLLTACSKSRNTVTNFTLSANEIWGAMSDVGAGNTVNFYIRDSHYSLPSESYIAGAFSESLKSFLYDLSSSTWKTEENDCDDFALAATFLMNFLHHNTVRKVKNSGIAFGEFYYIKDDGSGGHAINVAIVRENETLKVLFYEPQTYSLVNLSQTEIESCTFWRF